MTNKESLNIAMFSNAYWPVVGGLERSVATFADDLRELGHRVLIVTLAFPGAEESEETIFRLPAVKEIGGTQFSFKLPVPAGLKARLDRFAPDIVHSHHPFMVGDTALRVARARGLPAVFTHHTMYERYTYLFSRESQALQRIAMAIATEYANLCDRVVAPTASIQRMIRQRGVRVPIDVIPTGVDVEFSGSGDGAGFRRKHGIPPDAFVLGYLGRVVEAKNMEFLAQAVARFLQESPDDVFLAVGDGESVTTVRRCLGEAGVADRLYLTGALGGRAVADAYAAMDLFAFASRTETQGIVLIESFCAGVPIVALDAPGARDIVQDGRNGVLLDDGASAERFAEELLRVRRDDALRGSMRRSARERARDYDRRTCANQLEAVYRRLCDGRPRRRPDTGDPWPALQERFATEWDLFREKIAVITAAVRGEEEVPRLRSR